MNYKKSYKITDKYFFSCMGIWGLFCIVSVLLIKSRISFYNQEVTVLLQLLFQCLIIFETTKIRKKLTPIGFIKFFEISNYFLLSNNLIFFIIAYLLKLNMSNSLWVVGLIALSYELWAVFSIIFWFKIFRNFIHQKNDISKYVLFCVPVLLVNILFIATSNWLSLPSDYLKFFHFFSGFLELAIFVFSIILLICAESSGIYKIILGLITFSSGDFFIKYYFIYNLPVIHLYGSLFWLLGMILIFFGLRSIRILEEYDISIWFNKITSVKSQLGFWGFGASILSFILFFIFAYVFSVLNKQSLINLIFFAMLYPVIVVLLSTYIGLRFEAPFKKLKGNIEAFIATKNKNDIDEKFELTEFIFLNKFIIDSIQAIEDKEKVKQDLVQIAAQVAHDIRSPLIAIETFVQAAEERLNEKDRLFLRNTFSRINEIAQNMVLRYKGQSPVKKEALDIVLMAICLFETLAEKRVEYKDKNFSFNCEINPNAYFAVINGCKCEIKRMLSNLMNNAVNAMPNGGVVNISMAVTPLGLLVELTDQGCGMSAERIDQLLLETPPSEVKIGLGLTHAKNCIKKSNGTLKIKSSPNMGVKVVMSFPMVNAPSWLCTKLYVTEGETIVIIDDDQTIHDTWNAKLLEQLFWSKDFLFHFNSPQAFLDWFNMNQNKRNLVVLSDYEFFGTEKNGLDILSQIEPIKKRILVTSHYDEMPIVRQCIQKGIKILPKHLIPFFNIKVDDKRQKTQNDPELIFIDDNVHNTKDWLYFAKCKGVEICTFNHPEEFIAVADSFSKQIPIYIDQDLGLEKTGVDFAKKFSEVLGFNKIYIATGYQDFEINDSPWVAGVISKKPPFMN